MISESEIKEIREHLESAQNPLFFFDNDVDGLVAFLLLRRFIGRGKGVAIKSFPDLDAGYTRKIRELNPDKIFILDKALVSEEFLEYTRDHNLPVIWIDHHEPQNLKDVFYYNPLHGKKKSKEPTSYLCWKVVKQDDWLALVGCLNDWFLPEFAKEFSKKYPDLLSPEHAKDAGDAKFTSQMGKLLLILSFGMKDSTTNLMHLIRSLFVVKSPYEILNEDKKFETTLLRYRQINKVYTKLLEKALKQKSGKINFFKYSGDMSMSRDICNALFYHNPKKIVMVVYAKGEKVNISLTARGVDLRKAVAKALEEIPGSGGGHAEACGASVMAKDLDRFKEIVESYA